MDEKKCPKCGEVKPVGEFWRCANSKSGLQSWCKGCLMSNPNRRNSQTAYYRKKNMGMTAETYSATLESQGFRCAVCGEHQDSLKRALSADHCHETGTIRGLLCGRCNMGLGYFLDSPALLAAAIEYLNKYQNQEK